MKTNRRKFIHTVGASTVGLTFGTTAFSFTHCKSSSDKNNEEDGQIIFIGDNIAINETEYGKVRGFIHKGVYNFLGIPYGANTTGKNRFMPAQKPTPWKDIFPAVYWPNAAPQMLESFYADKYAAFTDYWHYDDVSENCLGINIWTPGYNDNKKRPVLLWIHGGGFMSGNSIEHPQYHGENLSRKEDVVFCSLNHRLGPLGFSDFSGVGGEKYAASGNVGILDIVAALEWIHNNIENFGGDPGNVTIMGQSGGGAKVCTLVSMFSAKGLFHKAVALSGNITGAINKEFSVKMGAYILKEAGLSASQINKLHDMPWRDYYTIAMRASDKINKEMGGSGMMRGNFGPVADEINLPKGVFFSDPNDYSAQIPMIISSTFYERSPSAYDSSLENITLDEVKDKIKEMRDYSSMRENVPALVDAYAKSFPDMKPIEIMSMIFSNRKLVMDTVEAKIKQPAPVYVAWFGWNTPLFDGRLRAFHTMDIAFWFYNTDVHISHTGGGARPRKLAAIMSSSLAKFMKNGDPNGGGLPDWPKYTTENGATMILDDVCEVKNDPDRKARKYLPV